MDILMFLDPVDESVYDETLPQSSFQRSIFVNKDIFYELDGIDIVILGVYEHGGSIAGMGTTGAANSVRKELYQLAATSGKNRILDLGNLRSGPTLEETYKRLSHVIHIFLDKGIVPIVIGGTHDLDIGQYMAYEDLHKMVTYLCVDSRFDISSDGEPVQTHVNRILRHDPNFLFHYIHLAYQTYFVHQTELNILDKLFFEAHRLGDIRQDIKNIEPIVRDADLISFDVSAIQAQSAPGALYKNVFGLTGEEACQIAWYAGQSERMSSFGIYNYDTSKDYDSITAQVIATMIWYFIEGYYQRKESRDFKMSDYVVYDVLLDQSPGSIKFYKSIKSEKWWVELPAQHDESVFIRPMIMPCGHDDYINAQHGELPERWLAALQRLS